MTVNSFSLLQYIPKYSPIRTSALQQVFYLLHYRIGCPLSVMLRKAIAPVNTNTQQFILIRF
jgi:hypothetical protein